MPSGNVVVPLLVLTTGGVLVWSGITNPDGGTFKGLAALLKGQNPSANRPAVFSGVAADLATIAGSGGSGSGGGSGASDAVATASGGSGIAPPPSASGATGAAVSGSRAKVLAEAKTWIGVPYKWAGTTKAGVDCSGFTMAAFKVVGVKLPHLSTAQAVMGKGVKASDAQPGDLVAFGTPVYHVGIVTGSGQCIHAPHTGADVRYESIASVASTVAGGGVIYRNLLGSTTSAGKAA